MSIHRALDYLLDLIETGVEYPDAQWKASQAYGVDADELQEAYDNHDAYLRESLIQGEQADDAAADRWADR